MLSRSRVVNAHVLMHCDEISNLQSCNASILAKTPSWQRSWTAAYRLPRLGDCLALGVEILQLLSSDAQCLICLL